MEIVQRGPSQEPMYSYSPLDNETGETRLVELLPGGFGDDICLKFVHVKLGPTTTIVLPSQQCCRTAVQQSLPNDWIAWETLQGRIMFERQRECAPNEPLETSWTHPLTGEEPTICRACCPESPRSPYQYEALSHFWGSYRKEVAVWVSSGDRGEGWAMLPITKRLEVALRYLRHQSSSRMLWIDMISINQDDVTERGHQVKQMGEIFRLARRVVVWLGLEDHNSALAFAALEHFGQQVELADNGRCRLNVPGCAHPEWSRTAVPLPYTDEEWAAIICITDRPWFRRLWVWQEAKLGNERSIIQCGHGEMLLQDFGKSMGCTAGKATTQSLDVQALLFNAGDATQPRLRKSLLTTLLHLNRKECLDPRDKIYGALGLMPSLVTDEIVVNYSRPVHVVYQDAIRALFKYTKCLDFLIACDLTSRTIRGPTWTPDLSVPARRASKWQRLSFRAGDEAVSRVSFRGDQDQILEAMGIRVGCISWVGMRASEDSTAIVPALNDWVGRDFPEGVAGAAEAVVDTFIRTLHWGFLRERFPGDYSLPTLAEAKTKLQSILSDPQSIQPLDIPQARGRTFFTTTTGSRGLSNVAVIAGDLVYVLRGCLMPVILRPAGDCNGLQVVGATYLDGFMDAEAVLGPLDPEWNVDVGERVEQGSRFRYTNTVTGEVNQQDPRYGPLPAKWESLDAGSSLSDGLHLPRYRNREDGNVIYGDPRLLPEALEARGVHLETLRLV